MPYPPPATPPPRPLPSRRRLWLIGITTAVVASGLGAIGIVSSVQARRDPTSRTNERALVAACRAAVAEHLQAPASARWMRDEAAGRDEAGVWRVTGGVVASNLYGVPLSRQFECTADWERDHSWRIVVASVR